MAVNMRNQAAQRTLKLDIVRAIACVGTLTSRGRGKQIFTRRGRIAARGLFSSFYTDRGSHYFFTPEAGGKVSKEVVTQVGRALAQLGIKHIAAYSPEARGR